MDMLDRLTTKVEFTDDCWNWTAACTKGYGRIRSAGAGSPMRVAHLALWEEVVGAVPEGWELDHLCRNKGCVNPDHLEVVTSAENTRRSYDQEFCRNGHRRTPDNQYTARGKRECMTCRREAVARYEERQRLGCN